MKKLLVLDLDGTLWEQKDVQQMVLKFEILRFRDPQFKVEGNLLIDVYGREVRLFEGAREFLEWAKERFILSIASWNVEEIVRPILEAFGIWEYFLFPKIENHPDKADMIRRTVEQLESLGYEIREVVYVDDNGSYAEVKKKVPNIEFIHMWSDVKNFEELKKFLGKN
ncbi:magnesium-dependent phosphatase-1 [Thermococcus argininiproducens]|uniref:Magnesium-dependent phosphatase-1 n=1 Tax=Thermococcus argininiproducens TaxID=2866384 RepID=A0A9E7M943_9EURY|nr:magnesium-dependent phosphatase-1 [Thermococcus argininiproducens]USG99639.1 magnesium-dependent phosphatase-1 [Thermococcus argininiproducens]